MGGLLRHTVADSVEDQQEDDQQLEDEAVIREAEVFIDDAGEGGAGEVAQSEGGREHT